MLDRGKSALLAIAAIVAAATPAWGQTEYTGHRLPVEPSDAEQLVLEIINRARQDPNAEAVRLSIPNAAGPDITEGLCAPDNIVGVRPPLAMNGILLQVARAHSLDMYTNSYFSHFSQNGDSPFDRMLAAGYNYQVPGGKAGENIAARGQFPGPPPPADILEDDLMRDIGYPCRGHRVNLLDTSGTPYFREVGLGYTAFMAPNGQNLQSHLTQNFGRIPSNGPFVVGVVFDDTLGPTPGFYDPGEGLGGVRVELPNGDFAMTSASGGYAVPVGGLGGTINVLASGGPLVTPIGLSVSLTSENVKLDFESSSSIDSDGDLMPDGWELLYGLNPNNPADAALDADLDTFTNLEEFQGSSDPTDNMSVPAGDADGDNMDNQWEVSNGFDPNDPSDAALDADLDTFTNLEEFQGGSDPNDNTSVPPGDADGDGMDNQWEISNGFDPNDPADASLDSDGDGFTNLEEFLGGSDPNDINSVPPPPGEESSGCGSTGVDLLWPLGLLWLARRRRTAAGCL